MRSRGADPEGAGQGPSAAAHSPAEDTRPSGAREAVLGNEDLDEFLFLWDLAEGITLNDPAEVARPADFRALFWTDMEQGGFARKSAIRDLLKGLLDWLEAPLRHIVDELLALARQEPNWDVSDLLDEGRNPANVATPMCLGSCDGTSRTRARVWEA